jgi:thymidylate kinase
VIVAIDGPDGAGKSTHVALLHDWLTEQGIASEVVSKWHVLDAQYHPDTRFLRGTELAEFRLCIAQMPSLARSLFIMWLYAEVVDRAAKVAPGTVVILDGFWMKHAAAELAYGCDPRLVDAIVANMAAGIGTVDAVLYLDVEPEVALERKLQSLTPYECRLDMDRSPAHFIEQQMAIRSRLLEWADREGWLRVAASGPLEATQREIRKLVLDLVTTRTARTDA